MLRTACAAVCLIAIGCVALCGAAWAQDRSHHQPPRSMSFGERLDRIRRNLIGDDEEVEAPVARVNKATSKVKIPTDRELQSAALAYAKTEGLTKPQVLKLLSKKLKSQIDAIGDLTTDKQKALAYAFFSTVSE